MNIDDKMKAVLEDRDWWKAFGQQFGWKLSGWSGKHDASFRGADGQRIEVTEYMRNSIQAAFDAQQVVDSVSETIAA